MNPCRLLLATLFVCTLPGAAAAQPFAYVSNADDDTISIVNTAANAVVNPPIRVGSFPIGICMSPDGARAYVANSGDGTVSIVATATHTVVGRPIPVGSRPFALAFTPDGRRVYVVNAGHGSANGTLSVIDTTTDTVVGAPVEVGRLPGGIAITPDGSRAYVANFNDQSVSVIDTMNAAVIGAPINVGGSPTEVAITPDGTRAYVTNGSAGTVSVLDLATNTNVRTINIGPYLSTAAVAPNGLRAYVARVQSGLGSLIALGTASNAVIDNPVPVGRFPNSIAISADGARAYVVNMDDDNVSVVDTTSGSNVINPLRVGRRPFVIAIQPAATVTPSFTATKTPAATATKTNVSPTTVTPTSTSSASPTPMPTSTAATTPCDVFVDAGLAGTSVQTLAFDPQTANTLYAGTFGQGVFKSTDGGGHWTAINVGLIDNRVSALAVHPLVPTTIYAVTVGGGGFKSVDGGMNWSRMFLVSWGSGKATLVINPSNPDTMYFGDSSGIQKTVNGGGTWTILESLRGTYVFALAVDPLSASTLYAGTRYGEVFKSTDAAETWDMVFKTNVPPGFVPNPIRAVAIDPQTSSTVYAGSDYGVHKTTDGGVTWVRVNQTHIDSLAIDTRNPSTVYATGGSRVSATANGGESWEQFNAGITEALINLAVDPLNSNVLYAATFSTGLLKRTRCEPMPTPIASLAPTNTATPTPTVTPSDEPTCAAKRPLIVLPGIYGSALADGPRTCWPTSDRCTLSKLRPTLEGLAPRPLGTEIFRDLLGFDVYRDFLDTMRVLNADTHRVYELSYDWRLDLRDATRRLAATISAAVTQERCDRVDIVAHSMGGLVAKALLAQDRRNERLVRRLLFIGTPHFGSPKAVVGITEGVDDFDGLSGPGIVFDLPPRNIAWVARNAPGAHQLLPTSGVAPSFVSVKRQRQLFGVDVPFTSVDIPVRDQEEFLGLLEAHSWEHQGCLPSGEACNCSMVDEGVNSRLRQWISLTENTARWSPSDPGLEAFILYGDGQRTPQRAVLSALDGSLSIDRRRGGDGTVPLASSRAAGVAYFDGRDGRSRRYRFVEEHSALVRNAGVQACVARLLRATPEACADASSRSLPSLAESADVAVLVEGEADLRVLDFLGNVTGVLPSGRAVREIENSDLDWLARSQEAYLPAERQATATVQARSAGMLRLRLRALSASRVVRELTYELDVGAGAVVQLASVDPDALPAASVDEDGDGRPDRSVDALELPVADAGLPQTAHAGNEVLLDGAGSSGPDEAALSFRWEQVAGPRVLLTGDRTSAPRFVAPAVEQSTLLAFALQVVAEGVESRVATASVTVLACGEEVCNGIDDDCDGDTDEADPETGDACGSGACIGTLACNGGRLICQFDEQTCEPTGCSSDANCDDGRFCNGSERCVDGGLCVPALSLPCEGACERCDEAARRCDIVPQCGTPSVTPISPSPVPTASATRTGTSTVTATSSPTILVGTSTPTTSHAPSPSRTFSPTARPTSTRTVSGTTCTGDCDGNGAVSIDELVRGVNIALGNATLDICSSFDRNGDGAVTIDELVRGVNAALIAC